MSRRQRSRLTVSLAVAGLGVLTGCGTSHEPLGPNEPAKVDEESAVLFRFEDRRINESSGLAASKRHRGIYYTHNDRGHGPQIYAVSAETGETEAVLELDTKPVDWEDIAVTDSGVWVGDIGGGDKSMRRTVSVLHFPEPKELTDGSPKFREYELTYEDGPHDAEALLVDPTSDQVYVVTKEPRGGAIYAAPAQLTKGRNILLRVAEAPPNVTAGSWSPDGLGFALRNYPRAFVYLRLGQGGPTVVTLPKTPQGESLVLLEEGDLLIGSEGERSRVLRVEVPRSAQE